MSDDVIDQSDELAADPPAAPTRRPDVPSDLVDRFILSGVIGAVVVTAAVLRDVAPWVVVVAVVVAVGAFWVADHLAAGRWQDRDAGGGAPGRGVPVGGAAESVAADLPPILDAGRVRDDSVDGVDLATGRTHIYQIRLAPHGEPAEGIAPAARIDARTASLAVAAPSGEVTADPEPDTSSDAASDAASDVAARAAAREWCERLVHRFTEDTPKPLSITSFDDWLEGTRTDLDAPSAALAGASIVTDSGSRVAVVMTLGGAAALVVSSTTEGPVVRAVVRSTSGADAVEAADTGAVAGLAPTGDGAPIVPATWSTVRVEPGDRLVVATPTIADWLIGGHGSGGDRRLDLLDRPTAAEIGAGLSDERIAGRLADGPGALAVVALAP